MQVNFQFYFSIFTILYSTASPNKIVIKSTNLKIQNVKLKYLEEINQLPIENTYSWTNNRSILKSLKVNNKKYKNARKASANFNQAHAKIIESPFSFVELVPDKDNLRVLWSDWSHPFLTIPNPYFFDHLLIFVSLYQHAKNQLIPFVHSSDTDNFRVLPQDQQYPFLIMPTPNIFKHFLWSCTGMQKHNSSGLFLRCSSFLNPETRWAIPVFWRPCLTKKVSINF